MSALCTSDRMTAQGAEHVASASTVETYPAGTVIADRYRVESVLGIGGFGAVYQCTQLNMDQIVAVKVLRGEHITSDEHVKRFEREARAASKLRHPNTISMFDFGTHTDGALFLAMEYLEGETLADRLDSGNTLSAEQLVHIMTQVCHSLTEAHESALVHRDLKPENIMLMSVAGDPNYVKVLDFGIAKVDDDNDAHEERLTEMGMIMGTPTYMSPEQAYGKILDARSDIYALGVLMYEGLTGRVPFEGDKPMEVLVKHINNPPAPPTSLDPTLQIPKALEKVVLRCLEKKADDRPQTTLELANLLQKALETPDDALLKGRAPAAPTPDVAATTHVPGLAEQTTAVPVTSNRQRSATNLPQQPGKSGGNALWIGLAAFSLVAIIAVSIALLATPSDSGAAGKDTDKDKAAPTAATPAKVAETAPTPPTTNGPHPAGAKEAPVPSPAKTEGTNIAAQAAPVPEARKTGVSAESAAPQSPPKTVKVAPKNPVKTKQSARVRKAAAKATTKSATKPPAKAAAHAPSAPKTAAPAAKAPSTAAPAKAPSRDEFRLDDD